ncbi:bifunctional UDP-N-acetylglucosamine diphosphorylase/glucosamine-1-phosphate N-acetyltransferase GlmU [uncultured Clostridium sp.]|uniref:bifunctional UDP-N-acetylglucosamine diphosphorylase/glucosamine-1-phosphate N-acetyltransferase GlmU n=1 Tax=uncultured Clostridium sp. TaxID=59620 RepID=UPI0025D9476E|nr:bifunctional UDP-N-acetylglucosamine diphosphorylase/glucosamine-1-phosphate N-acetyltransferase GlmU [uncultured Clostridium sp.]
MYKCSLVLAAGQGTRMKSKLPKVLHKVCGKSMVNHVIDTLRKVNIDDVNVIIGTGAELVRKNTEEKNVSYSLQEETLGTGHAVICAKEFLKDKKGIVIIANGDAPLIEPETLENVINSHISEKNYGTIITSIIEDSTGYGRIVRNNEGNVEAIVEHKDCNEEQLKIKEVNAGMYIFDIEELLQALDKLNNNNAQNEYYLTDVIEIMAKKGLKVGSVVSPFEETLGINSRVQLAEVESIMRRKINEKHLINGVTIIDPSNTYIGRDVKIEKDVIIYPGCILEGTTTISEDCVILQNSRIVDSFIGKGTEVQSSVILESKVGENTHVGPFAYIRPESNIGNDVKIGDFVEIKKSSIGNGTKVSHLTYVGDAEVGENVNFGCGTVTVNYDGNNKHLTKIGDNAFIGCNTNLVAPVEVEDGAYIAAGSTITTTVPSDALAVARARQVNIKNWVSRRGLYQKK